MRGSRALSSIFRTHGAPIGAGKHDALESGVVRRAAGNDMRIVFKCRVDDSPVVRVHRFQLNRPSVAFTCSAKARISRRKPSWRIERWCSTSTMTRGA